MRELTLIKDKSAISNYQKMLAENICLGVSCIEKGAIHCLADKHTAQLHIFENTNQFYSYKLIKGRHLNIFGVKERNDQFITRFQLSIPIEGENRRMGGCFGSDDSNNIFLLYRGIISGVPGIDRKDFINSYKGDKAILKESGDIVFVFNTLDKSPMKELIFDFVNYVDLYKRDFKLKNQR